MKKVVFASIMFFCQLISFGQSEENTIPKKLKLGFDLGANYSLLLADKGLPANTEIKTNVGFQLGVLADYQLAKYLGIRPKADLAFNQAQVIFTDIDESQTKYNVLATSLNVMTHFMVKNYTKSFSPYFFFGPNVKIPISKKVVTSNTFPTSGDFALDFGIGIDKSLKFFHFAPELTYSLGFLNVNRNPTIQSLHFHSISLTLNFLG